MSCIMSLRSMYVTEGKSYMSSYEYEDQYIYIFFVCGLFRIDLTITQNNLRFTCECS